MDSCEAHPWEKDKRRAIADVCHRLYERRYLVATSGNVSAREGDGFLITPGSTRKDTVTPKSIVDCRADGSPVDPDAHPSSEIAMHKEVYRIRPDISAAIHAHPHYCLACSLGDISLTEMLLPELAIYIGPVPSVPYATPGTDEMAETLDPFLTKHNAFLLRAPRRCLGALGKGFARGVQQARAPRAHRETLRYLVSSLGSHRAADEDRAQEVNRAGPAG